MPELPEVETTGRRVLAPISWARPLARSLLDNPVYAGPSQRPSRNHLRFKQLFPWSDDQVFADGDSKGHGDYAPGMSGSFRIVAASSTPAKHDHYDFVFGKKALRSMIPRRFGALLWTTRPALDHPLIAPLGPEPLGSDFDATYLYPKPKAEKPR